MTHGRRVETLSRRKRILLGVAAVVLAIGVGLAAWEVWTPAEIPWQATQVAGMAGWRADDLVVQHQLGDEVWATRGYTIYRSRAGGPFIKVATLPCSGLEPAAGCFRTVRQWTGRYDLTEVLPLGPDLAVAFAGGYVYRVDLKTGASQRVHALRHYGRGIGRGVMALGIARDEAGAVYYGEYWRNDERGPVRLYRSDDAGLSWTVACEFAPGEVRHIHAVQWDPYGKRLWLASGDNGPECRIGYSIDRGSTFTWIAQGDQHYRACAFLLRPGDVLWATDTGQNHLMRWTRQDGRVEVLADLPSACYYAQGLDEQRGLLGLAEATATAWLVEPSGQPRKIFECRTPQGWQDLGAPPSIRLPRGQAQPGQWVYLNPIRTVEYPSTILRIARDALLEAKPPEPLAP
jgi:hypothetical protein